VHRSHYYVWAVLDVENWSSRPEVTGAKVQRALQDIQYQALTRAAIDPSTVQRQRAGDGGTLRIPGDVAKERVTTQFVSALLEILNEYNLNCGGGEEIRIRLALNAGDAVDGEGEWSSRALTVAHRLVNAAVVRRVLAAALGNPLVVVASGNWYDAVIKEGHAPKDGWQQIWVVEGTFADIAWVKVPGRTRPPGLGSQDDPSRHRLDGQPSTLGSQDGTSTNAGDGEVDNSVTHGNRYTFRDVLGDVVFGDKYGNAEHDAPKGER
jgi:hypothetical protein